MHLQINSKSKHIARIQGGAKANINIKYANNSNGNDIYIVNGMYPCCDMSEDVFGKAITELQNILTRNTCNHAKKIAIVRLLRYVNLEGVVPDYSKFQRSCCPCTRAIS